MAPRAHGALLARDVGEIVGVSGTTIGQWARRGLIRSSQSDAEPRVYGVEDVAEASVVAALLARGLSHGAVHRAIERLNGTGSPWPLSDAWLATTEEPRPRLVLRENGAKYALDARGWQRLAVVPELREVRVRLNARASPSLRGAGER
jgi:DNA-binding transcriptional MerR regulator